MRESYSEVAAKSIVECSQTVFDLGRERAKKLMLLVEGSFPKSLECEGAYGGWWDTFEA